jgi:spore germination protein KC
MRKILFIILLFAGIIPCLTSCYDAREIDSWAYVYSMGVDKGVSDRLRITIQILNLKDSKGGGADSNQSQPGGNVEVITIDCPSFYTGVNMINTSLSREINYMHSKFFVVSQDLAKDDIGRLMNAFVRDRQIRRTMHFIVVRGKASELINEFHPILGTAISKTQEGLMDMSQEIGLFDDESLGSFMNDMKSSKAQPVGVLAAVNNFSSFQEEGPQPENFKTPGAYYAGELPRKGGNKIECLGTALFNEGKMIGELNGDETRALLMIKGEYRTGSFVFADPYEPNFIDTIIIRQRKKPKINITFKQGKPVIDVKVFLDGDLRAIQSTVDYEKKNRKPVLEKTVKDYMKKELDKTIEKCKGLNCDAFGFGEKAVMKFLTLQKWEKYDWLSHFQEVKVTTHVDFVIKRTGTLIKTNEIDKREVKK